MTAGIAKHYELELAQERQKHEIRKDYIEKATDPTRPPLYQARVFRFLIQAYDESTPIGRWAAGELKDVEKIANLQREIELAKAEEAALVAKAQVAEARKKKAQEEEERARREREAATEREEEKLAAEKLRVAEEQRRAAEKELQRLKEERAELQQKLREKEARLRVLAPTLNEPELVWSCRVRLREAKVRTLTESRESFDPESDDPRIVKSAARIHEEGFELVRERFETHRQVALSGCMGWLAENVPSDPACRFEMWADTTREGPDTLVPVACSCSYD